MIQFLLPVNLLLLGLIPLFVLFFIWRDYTRRRLLARIGDPQLVTRLLRRVSQSERRTRTALWLLAVAAAIVATARPTLGSITESITPLGAEVIFLVDVSLSMDATDLSPSRLTRARLDALDLARQLPGSSIGIAVFAGIAQPYMPSTIDASALEIFLNSLTSSTLQVQGTALASALNVAAEMFDTDSESPAAIVIFSDGEDHEGTVDIALLNLLDREIAVYALGYGTEQGSTIPVFNPATQQPEFKMDSSGNLVLTSLRLRTLEDIAAATGGAAYRASEPSAVSQIASTISALQGDALQPQTITRPIEHFPIPLLIAIVLLMLSLTLREQVRVETS